MKLISDYTQDYTVIDLETTGLSIESDEIIEVAALRIRGRKISARFSMLVKPEHSIPEGASAVNHITDDMVAECRPIEDILPKFIEFIGDDVLVGHNIHAFDLKLICRDAAKLGITLNNSYVDSVLLARTKLPHLKSRSLEYLSKYYRVPYNNAHRGMRDCVINYHVYEHLIWTPVPESETKELHCPMCNNVLKIRVGDFGNFFGCESFPRCRYTESISS